MAMGKRKQRQESLFITADNLPRSDGHPFYQKLNALLAEAELRSLDRRPLPAVLRAGRDARQAEHSAGRVLSHAAGRLLRGPRQPARHRLALCRQSQPAGVSGRAAGPRPRPTTRRCRSRGGGWRRKCSTKCFSSCWRSPTRSGCWPARRWASTAPRWRPTPR